MTYEIGVTSGLWSIARDPSLLGLGKKVESVTTYGVNWVQADIETFSTAELFEPDFVETIIRAKETLGLNWGMHGEMGLSIAWESALGIYWRISHRKLHQYLDQLYEKFIKSNKKKYRPSYINFHISNDITIGFFIERFRRQGAETVDFKGRENWIDLIEKTKDLKEWFLENLLPVLFREFPALWQQIENADPLTKYEEWKKYTRHTYGEGRIIVEELAYILVAKYLELKKDDSSEPLWRIFFPNHGSLEDLSKSVWGTSANPKKIINSKTNEIYLHPDIIAMVATRYEIGHFETLIQEVMPEYHDERASKLGKKRSELDQFYFKSAVEKMGTVEVMFTFENPELGEGQIEGLLRIIHGIHMYNFMLAFNKLFSKHGLKNWTKLIIDFEHWVHNTIDPDQELKILPADFGKYVYAAHLYYPSPLHEHNPIEQGTEEQRKIYRWLLVLRQKGFKQGLLIFERGGRTGAAPQEFIKTTVFSLREIAKELDKDTPPDKLPLQFYGVEPAGFLSSERQLTIIKEHARDPLKGMLSDKPEEEYTFLSKAAIEEKRKRPEDFKKEELR